MKGNPVIKMPRIRESFEQALESVIYPNELEHLLFGDAGWPVVQSTNPSMSFTATECPTTEDVVFPTERFITYEPSDAVWAVPLGIARVVLRKIRRGDVVDINLSHGSASITGKLLVQSVCQIADCWEVSGECVVGL
jgi:hypothetical protein